MPLGECVKIKNSIIIDDSAPTTQTAYANGIPVGTDSLRYDSTKEMRVIIKLNEALDFTAKQKWLVPVSFNKVTFDFETVPSPGFFQWNERIVIDLVTADFDISAVTWNNQGDLTYSASAGEKRHSVNMTRDGGSGNIYYPNSASEQQLKYSENISVNNITLYGFRFRIIGHVSFTKSIARFPTDDMVLIYTDKES